MSRRSPVGTVSVLIWTTTPWTIPSNLAIAFHPDFDYGAYEVDGRVVILATSCRGRRRRRPASRSARRSSSLKGAAFEGIASGTRSTTAPSVGVLADYVTLEAGTGAVHTAPGHGADDYRTGVQLRLEIYAPVGPSGRYTDDVGLFAGMRRVRRQPEGRRGARGARRAVASRDVPAQLPALLALPQPGDLPRHLAVVRRHGPAMRARPARRDGAAATVTHDARAVARRRSTGVDWIPAWGEERIHNMLANRPDWCISRQRSWGVPIPARRLHVVRRGAADAGAHRARRVGLRRPRRRRLVRAADRGVRRRPAPPARRAAARRSSASRTSSTCGSIRARATKRCSAPTPT